jgi:carbon storage regulator
MLIITRRPGEKIMLGDDTVIEVIEVSGSSVRIGIDAPRSIPVYREEIWRSVKEENAAAAQSDASVLPSDLPVTKQRKDLDSSCP